MTFNFRSFFRDVALATFIFLINFSIVNAKSLKETDVAVNVEISLIDGIVADQSGNVFISTHDHHSILRIDKNGKIKQVIGGGISGFSGDGGPASEARLKQPAGLVFDKKGNLYIADRNNNRVRKVNTNGIITTIAGNGTGGFSGDGGPATKASLDLPAGMAFDSKGNLYISDRSNNRVRMVDTNGIIKTVAGNGGDQYKGDKGPAIKAELNKPFGLAIDKNDNLYIADRGNNRIRKVDTNGIITTVAGDGGFYFIGDNGPAYNASIAGPTGVAVDDEGNLFIADRNNNRVRMVDVNGLIRTIAGTGQRDYNGDGELARETNLYLPFALTMDPNGKLLIVDRSHYTIRRVDIQSGSIETIAGSGKKKFKGDGGPATGAGLYFPHGIAVDKNDNVIFSDKAHFRIRQITPDGMIDTIAGSGMRGNLGDGGPALEAELYSVTSLILNDEDEMYFTNPSGFMSLIRKIDKNNTVHLLHTTSDIKFFEELKQSGGFSQSSKSNLVAISQFSDIALDKQGNLIIPDSINHQIRKVTPDGQYTTIAGNGSSDFTGDGGPAIKATFAVPVSVTLDEVGNIYVGDSTNNRIRKIDTNGIVTTIAGNGEHKDTGDGGPAIEAGIRSMSDLAFSPSGELYIVGSGSHKIRKIKKDGTIVTVAGKGYQGYFGDGGPGEKAMLKTPTAIAFDSKGNAYITDLGNNRIRKLDTNGIISTLAGTGSYGWGDEGEEVNIIFHKFP
jgi:serine/threonine protein kinase, bacterial